MTTTTLDTPHRVHTPVTAKTARIRFYDIESLNNVFTLSVYLPEKNDAPAELDVFYLIDDDDLNTAMCSPSTHDAVRAHIMRTNTTLPAQCVVKLWNLRDVHGNLHMARMFGLSDAPQVANTTPSYTASTFPADFRPVCDTDSEYDPQIHPFLAGYNSHNYDTTMLALYLSEVFGATQRAEHAMREAREQYAHHKRNVEAEPHNATALHYLEHASNHFAQVSRNTASVCDNGIVQPTTAQTMREHNNTLFTQHADFMPAYLWDKNSPVVAHNANAIRANFFGSGRHFDVARLNEIGATMSLKRQLGLLGRQIKESHKLTHDATLSTIDELTDLLAYNVADCVGCAHLFDHPTYSSNFDLKASLLTEYSETRYTDTGAVRPGQGKNSRLIMSSSSAQFVSRILAPSSTLDDLQAVSFLYPHEDVARAQGVPQVNVLHECVRFFHEHICPDPQTTTTPLTQHQRRAYQQFMDVVNYYASLEGKNFNDSEQYQETFGKISVFKRHDIAKTPNNIPYFSPNAQGSQAFVTFSVGGIHGAEYDLQHFIEMFSEHNTQLAMLNRAQTLFPSASDFVTEAQRQHNTLTLPNGETVMKNDVLIGARPETVRYRTIKAHDVRSADIAKAQQFYPDPRDLLAQQRPAHEKHVVMTPAGERLDGSQILSRTSVKNAAYRDTPRTDMPVLFTSLADGSTKLNPQFVYTSADAVIHEDFTSYYPNLLRNMRAFYNPSLGEDRYAKIFEQKETYGGQIKALKAQLNDPTTPPERAEEIRGDIARLTTLRNGTKLILNAASGAGDARHDTPIKMTNRIISMRIIGQLFSWRIGQAQTLAGARIVSTNTDGLYSALDAETNNEVLREQQAQIHIDIEPEPMFIISKDSNNRLELTSPRDPHDLRTLAESEILSASGGTLACQNGPVPTKRLSHPAVIDYALARYLRGLVADEGQAGLRLPFDRHRGEKWVRDALSHDDPVHTLRMFQNIIAGSRASRRYPFAVDPYDPHNPPTEDACYTNPRVLQMDNRVFTVTPGTPGAVSLYAAGAWKIPPATLTKRQGETSGSEYVYRDNDIALNILRSHGWARSIANASNTGLSTIPNDHDVTIRKITHIDPTWSMLIVNDDLHTLPVQRLHAIIDALDVGAYVDMLENTYTTNWKNA